MVKFYKDSAQTFFAEYDEPVTKLPSLLTFIDGPIREEPCLLIGTREYIDRQ